MKTILFILLVMISTNLNAKKDYSVGFRNNVMLITKGSTKNYYFNDDKKNNTIFFSLNLYTDGKSKQYTIHASIKAWGKEKFMFIPASQAKVLVKLENESIIELKSIYESPYHVFAGFDIAITEQQLIQMFDGIQKMRIEILTLDKESESFIKDYRDIEFNSKFAKDIKTWYDAVNEGYEKEKHRLTNSIEKRQGIESKDIRDNF